MSTTPTFPGLGGVLNQGIGAQQLPNNVPTSLTSGHKVLVSLVVLVVVAIILVEVAGVSKEWAEGMGILLLAILVARGFSEGSNFLNFSQTYPYQPY